MHEFDFQYGAWLGLSHGHKHVAASACNGGLVVPTTAHSECCASSKFHVNCGVHHMLMLAGQLSAALFQGIRSSSVASPETGCCTAATSFLSGMLLSCFSNELSWQHLGFLLGSSSATSVLPHMLSFRSHSKMSWCHSGFPARPSC